MRPLLKTTAPGARTMLSSWLCVARSVVNSKPSLTFSFDVPGELPLALVRSGQRFVGGDDVRAAVRLVNGDLHLEQLL